MILAKYIFRYLFNILAFIFKFSTKYKGMIPVGMFIVSEFIINLIRGNFFFAFKEMAKTVLGAELVINEMVHLAIVNSVDYGFISFFRIIISLYILFTLVRVIANALIGVTGSQAEIMAYVFAVPIVFMISVSAVAVYHKQFGFIPIWDSLVFMILNIKAVILNVFSKGVEVVVVNPII